jgi:lysophospholipase L1-like esterase
MSVIRRGLLILALLSCLSGQVYASGILGIGDSIALGQCSGNVGPWPELATLRGLSETTYNAGIGGNSAAQVDGRIGDLLTSADPDLTVVIVGSNDVRFLGTTLSAYLSSISSITTKITGSGSSAVICQITPVSVIAPYDYGRNETGQQNEKLWNAALEDWCATNSVPMSANYQKLCQRSDYEDDLQYDSTCVDGVHVSVAGYTVMANLIHHAAIPIRKRVYGDPSFPRCAMIHGNGFCSALRHRSQGC